MAPDNTENLLASICMLCVTLKNLYAFAETLPGWNPYDDKTKQATWALERLGLTNNPKGGANA